MRRFNGMLNYLGSIIQTAREEKNMSREDLAQQLQLKGFNVDRVYIHKIETKSRSIKDFELLAFANILYIDLNTIAKKLYK